MFETLEFWIHTVATSPITIWVGLPFLVIAAIAFVLVELRDRRDDRG